MSTNDNKRIVQLSKDVVDKIAAGEVIVRPMNAVKELLENSLDAGATEISISIGGGGMELIKIQDNGHGIDKEDLPIACNRFATSKLQKFEDLRQICTYGFRGEALASISHVANLTIITRGAADKCAHKATFKDGQIVGQISQCAGVRGTIICVEKLFHNAPHRLASISRQATEEANRIADLIVRYAIHYPNVAFGYRRLDGGGFDFRSPGNGDQHGTIRTLMHEKATKELVNIEFADSSLHFTAKACLCTPAAVFTSKAVQSRHDKFKVFHLFINGRCVDSPRLQRAFDAVFVSKDALCPFISFSLKIEPQRVDVNVHPTKAIVHFLEEDRIIERIEQEMHQFLTDYRTRDTIPSMPFVDFVELNRQTNQKQSATAENDRLNRRRAAAQIPSNPKSIERTASANSLAASNSTPKQPKVAAKNKIRVDFSNRSLDEFLLSRDDLDNPLRPITQVRIRPLDFEENEEEGESMENPINLEDEEEEGEEGARQSKSEAMKCIPRDFDFDSLVELRREICRNVDQELMEMFKRHILIGFFDTRHSLIQSGSSVFLLRNDQILRKFFYQLLIFSFGNMGAFDLIPQQNAQKNDGLSIRELLLLEEGIDEEEADRIGQSLLEHRKMLWDFFSIKILPAKSDSASDSFPLLASIPCLIDGFMPELEGLPHLLLQLGQVNFEEEQQSFFGIASALAEFHIPFMMDEEEENEESQRKIEQGIDKEEEGKMQRRRAQRALRAVIFPALRNRFLPSEDLREYCQQLTSTGQAFKHFGRC